MKEEKKKKKLWPIFLIIGIVVAVAAILLIAVITVAAIFIGKTEKSVNSFTYGDLIETMDMSKKPATVITESGEPFDYTYINDLLTKDSTAVEDWINNFYPGSSIQKNKYTNGDEYWVVTSSTSMNPVSVSGITFNYDKFNVSFIDGYAHEIDFIQSGGDVTEFNTLYNAIMFKYTYTGPNTKKLGFPANLLDPTYESISYFWGSNEFDGFYNLWLERTVSNSQAEIKLKFDKY